QIDELFGDMPLGPQRRHVDSIRGDSEFSRVDNRFRLAPPVHAEGRADEFSFGMIGQTARPALISGLRRPAELGSMRQPKLRALGVVDIRKIGWQGWNVFAGPLLRQRQRL